MTHPYASLDYARSLPHLGEPFEVGPWGAQVLVRSTPDGRALDAVGPYPMTMLARDADIEAGLALLRAEGLVSVVLVVDEAAAPVEALAASFDLARPFKTHHLRDRDVVWSGYSKHHRYEVRRAHAQVAAAEFRLIDRLDDWLRLYAELTGRRGLGGLHDFPLAHHRFLAASPRTRAFGAFVDDRLMSAHLFVVHDGYAISHLAASSAEGYRLGAAYAVNDLAIASLSDCRLVNLGGGAGAKDDPNDGLARFKRGFANRLGRSWLCGKVLRPDLYGELAAASGGGDFFPAYRGARREGAVA